MGYPYQSSVQNIDAVRFGSAKVEVSATVGTTTATFTSALQRAYHSKRK